MMNENEDLLVEALLKLKNARKKIQELSYQEPIAIIGMSCRFPGGANNPEMFWNLLMDGFDASIEVPPDRFNIDYYYDPNPDVPGKIISRNSCFMTTAIAEFDAQFFGISPREAEYLDPQQRLLLEVTWEALENAGINPPDLQQSNTGVFIGICGSDYATLLTKKLSDEAIDAYLGTGNAASTATGRISYTLGLQGPNMAIDTACSSSLVALHQACLSLRNGESNLMISGGVNVLLSPQVSIDFSQAHMLAPDGHCKTFDAAADGYVRGEGCGIVILKRLSDAQRDNNTILAIIKGSAINQDGASSGLTVPNGAAQEQVIKSALQQAQLNPDDIDYVEAHGTGTALGDPIEVNALYHVFAREQENNNRKNVLRIGTVKSNIGHLEASAGIAGVIKTVLALQHEVLPKQLHFKNRNPKMIDFDKIPAEIPLSHLHWKKEASHLRRAGVSSFAFSGTNAHIILEEAPIDDGVNVHLKKKPLPPYSFQRKRYWAKVLEIDENPVLTIPPSYELEWMLNLSTVKDTDTIHRNKQWLIADNFPESLRTPLEKLFAEKKYNAPLFLNLADTAVWSSYQDSDIAGIIYSIIEYTEESTTQLRELAQISAALSWPLYVITEQLYRVTEKDSVFTSATAINGVIAQCRQDYPASQIKQIDISLQKRITETAKKLIACLYPDVGNVVAVRNGKIYQVKLKPISTETALLTDTTHYKLALPKNGLLSSLTFQNYQLPELKAHDILIKVKAAAVNLRDVLAAMRLYQGLQGEVGLESSGKVFAVGAAVTQVAVGDDVFGITLGAYADCVIANEAMVIKKPHWLSYTQAAVLPIAYTTAYVSLVLLAQLKAGEKVLIHAAAGGVGLAAINIAKWLGAEIYATAGTEDKRNFLSQLGIKNIYHSRDVKFCQEILADTNSLGVDVVLNSLTTEGFIRASVDCVALQGRFVEIGRLNIWSHEQMAAIRPDIQYEIMELDEDVLHHPEKINQSLCWIVTRLEMNELQCLPYTAFPQAKIKDAFSYLQHAKNIGKVVIEMPEQFFVASDTSNSITTPAATSSPKTSDEIEALIKASVASVLGFDEDIDTNKGFLELGMDSLMAVELSKRLNAHFPEETFTSTLAFDYPTIAQLSAYIESQVTGVALHTDTLKTSMDSNEPIAIIGMSCRFPGGANNPQAFWDLLQQGFDSSIVVPKNRWDVDEYYDPNPEAPGKIISDKGSFLTVPIDEFDAAFFGISPREMVFLDPQQRLLLELSWEALENAGIDPVSLRGSYTGVFAGMCSNDYGTLLAKNIEDEAIEGYILTGNAASTAIGRISYTLGLQGPCEAIDTACSSALVALHNACQSLRTGECNLAIAAGVNIILLPQGSINLSKANMLAKDGHCKTFDKRADGYLRGEGGGVVILKPLTDAVQQGDNVLAIIKGYAVNHGGRSSGLSAPNGPAQEYVIKRALSQAQLKPDDIDYIEAQGTGTLLGDAIEMNAYNNVFSVDKNTNQRTTPLIISTVKTNIGHLEAASGMAALIKTILSLQHEKIPKHLHFSERNPEMIDFTLIPVQLPLTALEWKRNPDKIRYAGLHAFGISGTNAHFILQEAQEALPSTIPKASLPHHVFQRQRYWADALDHKKKYALEREQIHPLLGARLRLLPGRSDVDFENILKVSAFPYLKECALCHQLIFPNAIYIELMLAALQLSHSCRWKAIELKNISFDLPLAIEEKEKLQLAVTLMNNDGVWKNIAIYSQAVQQTVMDHEWTLITQGQVRFMPTTEMLNEAISLEFIKSKCNIKIDIDHFYQSAMIRGWRYGTTLQPIKELFAMDNSLLAKVAANKHVADCYQTNPILIEAAFQLMTYFLNSGKHDSFYIPIGFDSFRLYERIKNSCYIHLVMNEQLSANLTLLTDEGKLAAKIKNLKFQEISAKKLEKHFLITKVRLGFAEVISLVEKEYDRALQEKLRSLPMQEAEVILKAKLKEEIRKILRFSESTPTDDATLFFDMGMDSIMTQEFKNRVEQLMGIGLSSTILVDFPCIASLAPYLLSEMHRDKENRKALHPLPKIVHFPDKSQLILSETEKLSFDFLNKGGLFNIVCALKLKGTVDETRLENSLNKLVSQQEVFRLAFIEQEGQLQKVLYADKKVNLKKINLENNELNKKAYVTELMLEEERQPIPVEIAPLMRVTLIKLKTDCYYFILTISHVIFDGFSISPLIRDFAFFYNYPNSSVSHLPITYTDFQIWQDTILKENRLSYQLEYWRERLAGIPSINLPYDITQNIQGNSNIRSKNVTLHVAKETCLAIHQYTQFIKIDPSVVIISLFQLFLKIITGNNKPLLKILTLNRQFDPGLKNIVGFFYSVIFYWTECQPTLTLSEFIAGNQKKLTEDYDNQDVPLTLLYQQHPEIRPTIGLNIHAYAYKTDAPYFENLNYESDERQILGVEPFKGSQLFDQKVDLGFNIMLTKNALIIRASYRETKFEKTTILNWLDLYVEIINYVVQHPQATIEELELYFITPKTRP